MPSIKARHACEGRSFFHVIKEYLFSKEGGLLFLAALLRLWSLSGKPPHFDEGINGWFADRIREKGFYAYDPTNYHGPLYFYILFIFQTLFGRNLWALRLPAVIGSCLSVWLGCRFDRFFGKKAAWWGTAALAVSPAMIFYGRYAIHESWVMTSLMLFAWGLLELMRSGSRQALCMTFLGATLLLLLKETALIHLGCFFLAALLIYVWEKFFPSRKPFMIAPQRWEGRDLAIMFLLMLGVLLFFYSGTFLNCRGLLTVFETLPAWIHTGLHAGGHEKIEYQYYGINFYWIVLLLRYEWPALMGVLYALCLLFQGEARARYLAIYALGVLVAYSLIPYKTPWCLISIMWPFALLFGVVFQKAACFLKKRLTVLIVATVLLFCSGVRALRLNFWHATDFSEPYVYVQTSPEIERVTTPLFFLSQRDPNNFHLRGQICLESYYPLPWLLGDFTAVGYFSKEKPPRQYDGDFIVIEAADASKIEQQLEEPYYRREFQLRDAMGKSVVYFKKRIFAPFFKQAGFVPHEISKS